MNTSNSIARMIDISAVRADSTQTEIELILEAAKTYPFICIFVMPGMIDGIKERVRQLPGVGIGGIVGFPSGGETTRTKCSEAQEMKDKGCDEIDMVMNIGQLKSGMYEQVKEDILAVKQVVSPLPLKVIIEVPLLTDEEIVKASQIVCDCQVAFLKTGTGWAGSTTMHHIEVIKSTVGDSIPLKVAGGVRSLKTLNEMRAKGVSRFGIGYKSAIQIIEEASKTETA